MKTLLVISISISLLLFYGIYLSLYQFKIIQQEIAPSNPQGYYDYRGVTNVHSKASSGSGSYSEILQYAKNVNLDWIIITELNQPSRPEFIEGYFQDMLVLTGGEYSYLDSRLLYYETRSSDNPPQGQSQTQVFFADILSQSNRVQNDFVVLAHPYYSRYSWKGDFPVGMNGIEILNLKSILEATWKESKPRTILSLLLYSFNPSLAFLSVFSSPEDELVLWDQLNKKQRIIGFAGHDANAKVPITSQKYLEFPSYETSFGLASNHLLLEAELTGDYKKDKQKVLKALFDGQFYMSLDFLGSPKGFLAEMKAHDKNYPIGSKVPLSDNLMLQVQLPSGMKAATRVIIKKDGETYSESNSAFTNLNISAPGVYRVEILVNPKVPIPKSIKWVPWIYTNNFTVVESN